MRKTFLLIICLLICLSCIFAGKIATPLSLSYLEESISNSVYYLTKIWLQDDGDHFKLFFSLTDSKSNVKTAPAYVDIRIVNSNGELVYDYTKTIRSSDYGLWSNKTDGDMTLASIVIKDSDIKPATSETGTLYFTVYSPGYFEFSEQEIEISSYLYGPLPFKADYSNPVVVDPDSLDEDFDNELRVKKLYAGKPVKVTVKISSILKDYDGRYYITASDYQSGGDYKSYYLSIYMDDSALDRLANYKRDQKITVCGFVDTSDYLPKLVHAIILDK